VRAHRRLAALPDGPAVTGTIPTVTGSLTTVTGPIPTVTAPVPTVTGSLPVVTGSFPALSEAVAAMTAPISVVTGPTPVIDGPPTDGVILPTVHDPDLDAFRTDHEPAPSATTAPEQAPAPRQLVSTGTGSIPSLDG